MALYLATLAVLFILVGGSVLLVCSTYTHYRLPTSLKPELYQLKVITYLDNPANLTFEGHVTIDLQVMVDSSNITLHVQNLTIDQSRILLKQKDAQRFVMCLHGVETVPEQNYYVIHLCQTLHKGQIYRLKLYFSGILNDKLNGYYRSSYIDNATNKTSWLSVTQFEPTSARKAFPCFDEPSYKAKFIIWLGHHKSLTALSNMPMERQIPLDGVKDFVWSIFEESVPMSTYLVAYTINDFVAKESTVEGTDIVFRTWSKRGTIDQCGYTAKVAPKILKYYGDVFGIPFPLKKIDQVAIPNFSQTAMENWGLITYEEETLLVPVNDTSQWDKVHVTNAIAHELAHQWFGNLVTMTWWTDLWLNEGFATYIATLGVHHINPEWQTYNTESLKNYLKICGSDANSESHPISQPILNTRQILRNFDTISYNKGSAVLRMVHLLLGQDGFFESVHDYLSRHEYSNAQQDDLWAVFTETAHKFEILKPQHKMKTVMDSWTLQPGYPLVKVNRNYETGSIEISQQRFLKNSNITDEDTRQCWWIPLSYTTASEVDFVTTRPKAWLECDESGKSIPLKLDNITTANEWIMFNIQMSSVYSIMYDDKNWRLLQNTLNSDKFADIHVMNRAQLIDDAIKLAWNGYHGYDIPLDVLFYLSREREYPPWESALRGLEHVFNMLEHFPRPRDYFKAYMRYIIEPIYYGIGGLNAFPDTSTMPFRYLLKYQIIPLACRVDLDGCVEAAIDYFQQWKSSGNPDAKQSIPDYLRFTVYCTAIRHGNSDDWTFLYRLYKELHFDIDKFNMGMALTCSSNETLMRDFIALIFDKVDRKGRSDAVYAFRFIANSAMGAPMARKYFSDHFTRLNASINVADLFINLADSIFSTEDLNSFLKVIDSNKEHFKDSEARLKSAFEVITTNIQWAERNLDQIKLHLQRRLSAMGVMDENSGKLLADIDITQ